MQSIEEAVNYFGGEELPATVWAEKYAARNLQSVRVEVSPTQMHRRLAKEFARIERKKFKKPYSEDYLFSLFDKFSSVIPQGSPMAGIGVEQLVSLSNCFVVAPPTDSYGGIMRTDEQMVQLCKRRGGVGTDLSHIRPDDLPTSNSARKATGVVPFMRRYSNTIREVGQAGRRGALMLTLSVHHPQILDFARIKMNPDEVTGANVSVRLSDEFLSAVKAGTTYEQRWPVDSPTPQIRRQVDARTVWKEIITCAHARAEPGLLFWDHVLRDNPAECYADVGFGTVATNPCSEIPLSILDACRLLVVNLFTCVVDPFKKKANFDFLALYDLAYVAQRLMDDLVDLEIECIDRILKKIASDPEPEEVKRTERELWEAVRTSVVNGRRTGLGPTALGDAIAAVGLKYGSDESVAFTEEVYKTLKLAAYRSSVDMAKELGAFPVWDADKERDCPFLLRIAEEDPKLYRDMQKYGRRNIALLTTAPVGSVSLLAKIGPYFGSCSGIEPLFNDKPYTRRKKINHAEVGARVDFVDQQGDRWTEFEVKHAGIKLWSDVTGETDWKKSPYHKCCAEDLDWKQRVKLQAAAQKHIDHAISSCLAVGRNTVWTSDGLLDIGEIAERYGATNSEAKVFTKVGGFQSVNIDNKPAEVTAVYNNGHANVVELSLSNGTSMTCTPNHKVVVLTAEYKQEWREVGDLKPGEWVVGRKGLHLWGRTDRSLAEIVGTPFVYGRRTSSKDVTIPTRMSTSLARLIGYISADGAVLQNGVSLCQQNNNVGPDFCKLMLEVFGVETAIVPDQRAEGLFNYVSNSREVAAFFTWLGLGNHDENRVPKVIRCVGRDCVKEFLRGATLDGSVGNKNIVVASAVSKVYLTQMRELLLNWGIESRVLKCSEAGEREFPSGRVYATQEAWSLVVCDSREIEKFANEIGFAEDRKNAEMKSKWKRPSRIKVKGDVPDFGLRERFRRDCLPNLKSNRLYEMFHPMTCAYSQGRDLSRESLTEMADVGFSFPSILTDPTYTFSEVVSVKDAGVATTFDLSVPDANSYIANGFVSHNTINLPEDVSVEKVAEIYQAAWEQGCKGITVYRKNCRTGVLVDQPTAVSPTKRVKTSAPKRPKELKCEVHHTSVKGQPCVVLVGLLEDEPYEAFALLGGKEPIFKCKTGTLVKEKRGHYRFGCEGGEWIDVTEQLTDEQAAVTRLVSTSLRHGVDTTFVVQQLEKVKGEFNGFAKAVARTLKKYIKDGTKVSGDKCDKCGSENLVRQEGCVLCMDCGHSKCN